MAVAAVGSPSLGHCWDKTLVGASLTVVKKKKKKRGTGLSRTATEHLIAYSLILIIIISINNLVLIIHFLMIPLHRVHYHTIISTYFTCVVQRVF